MRRANVIFWIAMGLIAAAGCGTGEPPASPEEQPFHVLEDDAIASEVRNTITGIETRLLNGFEAADSRVLRDLLADSVVEQVESGPGLESMFDTLRQRITGRGMVPLHDIHVTISGTLESAVRIDPSEGQPFVVEFLPPGKDVYVSLREITGGVRTRLLGLIYAREEDGWRIHTLHLGALRASGRDALDWYNEAQGLESVGRSLPALLRLNIASDLLRPVPFLRYPDEQAVLDLRTAVGAKLEAAHNFPIEMDDLPGTPRILRFEPMFIGNALAPMVAYVTGSKLEQDAIVRESAELLERLTSMFEGICDGIDKVAFTAYAELPSDPNRNYPSVGVFASCEPETSGR